MKKHRLYPSHFLSGMILTVLMMPVGAIAQSGGDLQNASSANICLTAALVVGFLLLCSIILIFRFRSRYHIVNGELQDITTELETTRQRFTETSQKLEKTELNLSSTTQRYQDILFNAEIGVFQMDLSEKCTYVNSKLQELSGLYPKKAAKEGLGSVIHPDDRSDFNQAWNAFVKDNKPLCLPFRFKLSKGQEVYVMCRANKVLNERKDVESYIGWISNITDLHQQRLQEQAITSHYKRFIEDTIEGYYQLAPETPIPLSDSADEMAAAIMDQMQLINCNETFAGLYGNSPSALNGKQINELTGGCGPFTNNDSIKKLIEADYKLIDLDSVRQDTRGNRLNLVNRAIGIVEDNKLVGIWGSQRNVSQQKREKEELVSQARFMHRILDALPADVHVKDTRCRYLYASRKLSERTGIPQEDWIGKTIFEVLPATPRDHDKNAVEVMKSGKLRRVERSYEARNKSGWMETVQIPLVSEDGLVEGVVGLSLDISERRLREEENLNRKNQLEHQLQSRTKELQKSQSEHSQAMTTLRTTRQELQVRETELENRQSTFNEQLKKQKKEEDLLRRNTETLLTRQKQLEEQLAGRLQELETETDKRKKWEELLTLKEEELRKLEETATTRSSDFEKEATLRTQAEAELNTHKSELERISKELEKLERERENEIASLTEKQQSEFGQEHEARKAAEQQLKKTNAALQAAQTRIQTLIERHSDELEHEVAERKTTSAKLIQHAEELDELKRKFNDRIEEETKALKRELSQKQIHEKALRQQGKDLESRIKELEKTLQMKVRETNKEVEAREGAEVQRQQAEQQLKNMTSHQRQLVERETQKLNLQIAEIRLDEIRLRKEVGDLQQEREDLRTLVNTRATEVDKAAKEKEKVSDELAGAQAELKDLKAEQGELVARETEALREELKKLKQAECDLRKQEELLKKEGGELEKTIQGLSKKLEVEARNREAVEKELSELQIAFDASQENAATLVKEQTHELREQIKQHKQNETELQKEQASLKKEADGLRKTIETRNDELAEARKECEKAERELERAIDRATKGSREIEAQIAEIKREHRDEVERINDEQKELRKNELHYRTLLQNSADAILQMDIKSGQIQWANRAAAELFGEKEPDALTGKSMDALSPDRQPDDMPSADMAKARLHSALEAGQDSFEWQFRKGEKDTFHSLVSLSTIEVEERELVLAIIKDVTLLKQRQADLEQAIAEAQAANAMNTQVVDEITETVETSLHPVVTSSTEIEKAENLTEEQKHDMAAITGNCRSLIDSMHYRSELSHMADGSDEVEPIKCDLHELIRTLDQQFAHRAETKSLFFAVSYAQYQSANNVPKFVETDEHKVRTALTILLGYALAHTEKGRLGLHAARKSAQDDTVTVTFELTYTGIEKQDELLSRVFDSDSTGAEDMQYGLTLARRIVRQLGGDIILEYLQSDITALTINLPFKKAASEIVMPGKNSAEPKAGAA